MKAPVRVRWLILILALQAAVVTVRISEHCRRIAFQALSVLKETTPILSHGIQLLQNPIQPPPSLAPQPETLEKFSFGSPDALKAWEEKIFKGKNTFELMNENGVRYLKCRSQNACSGLSMKVSHEATGDLRLAWKWRPVVFPARKDPLKLSDKKQDDFALRMYVIFPSANIFHSDIIEYVWDEHIPAGTFAESPYSDRIMLFVLRSGKPPEENGGWASEDRNIYQDFVKLFGREPRKDIGAIALMSDSDSGETVAEADYGDIEFKRANTIAGQQGRKP